MTKLTVNHRFIVLFLSLQILFSLGCTTPQKYEGSREQFDDIIITTRVHEAIIDEPSLRPFDINIRTIKGIVELSGLVNSRDDMDKAIAIARKVEGIKLIKNDMRIYGTGDY
ncbi:MAG: BON domain-containing protein [Nitrosomonas sp.]|jgi:hyperosmotically inducible protein|uniref:BON domain-containing protein n=1 Tax=Nitrosomonas sp. TaxID=42353 RepID=UPI001DC0B4A2|nr:BON domain-containing protein [Nitrosomonas sp.]MBX9893689.1 BON domain-containing protein [Nitrosomonas sp.]